MIAKAAVTSNEMTLTGGGDNITTDVGGPKIYMSENKFKEIYETPTSVSYTHQMCIRDRPMTGGGIAIRLTTPWTVIMALKMQFC